jgi:Transposase zinc-binding domain
MSRPPLEVADVVRQYGAAFLARYGPTLSGAQHRALRAIAVCRTAALGGHITQCDHCGHEVQAYKPMVLVSEKPDSNIGMLQTKLSY